MKQIRVIEVRRKRRKEEGLKWIEVSGVVSLYRRSMAWYGRRRRRGEKKKKGEEKRKRRRKGL